MNRRARTVLAVILAVLVLPLLLPAGAPGVEPQALAGPDSQFVSVMGLDVHYLISGEGEPAVILLHGFGASSRSFQSVLPSLAANRKVIAYDRPGFGLTSRPPVTPGEPDPYSPSFQPVLLAGLLDQLGIERATLVGHSAGAKVALDFAAAYPDRTAALVLIAPADVQRDPPLPTAIMRWEWIRRPAQLAIRWLFSRRGDQLVRSAWHDPDRMPAQTIEAYRLPLMVRGWDRALWDLSAAAPGPDRDPSSLQEIPALIIVGAEDRTVPPDRALAVAQQLPDSRSVIFADCGHLPHEEFPVEFLQQVLPFLP